MHVDKIIDLLNMSYAPSERTRQRLLIQASLIDLLRALQESPSDIVREHLCMLLQAQPDDKLLEAFQINTSTIVKSWLCCVLKNRSNEQTIHALIAALDDTFFEIQSLAIEALEEIKSLWLVLRS